LQRVVLDKQLVSRSQLGKVMGAEIPEGARNHILGKPAPDVVAVSEDKGYQA